MPIKIVSVKNVRRILNALRDEDLQGLLDDDTRTLLTVVPGGLVAVNVCGSEVTPEAAMGALELIAAGIGRNGIPKSKVVEVKLVSTQDQQQNP
jgi:hypothetical protein